MGNSFGPKGLLIRFEPARLVVEVPQVHKRDQPDVVVGLFDADVLAGEDLGDVDLPAAVTDPAARGDWAYVEKNFPEDDGKQRRVWQRDADRALGTFQDLGKRLDSLD
jgi:hypothetical protein